MLRRLWRALLGPPYSPPPRLRELVERIDALEGDVSGLRRRVKTVEGQISGGKRGDGAAAASQDAPGATIGEPDDIQVPPPTRATAELARRFRRF